MNRSRNTRRQSRSAVDRFEAAWKTGHVPAIAEFLPAAESWNPTVLRDLICIDLARRWRRTDRQIQKAVDDAGLSARPRLEEYLALLSGNEHSGDPQATIDEVLTPKLIAAEYRVRQRWGDRPPIDEYRHRFPQHAQQFIPLLENLREKIEQSRVLDETVLGGELSSHGGNAVEEGSAEPKISGMQIRCPHCHVPVNVAGDDPLTAVACSSCGSTFNLVGGEETLSYRPAWLERLGRFELLEQAGVGAFGTVWKARDTHLGRTVAVKVPRRGDLSAEERDYFLREARAAAQLRHPGIVSVHEAGSDLKSGTLYIVSDFVEGLTLDDWLTGRQPTTREAAEVGRQIARALQHAHERGVVHRDLKPSNIMLDRRSRPHVMDFGLALRQTEVTMTATGQVLGTPAYMSPEQAAGDSHRVDARADVYALGVILFELLTGERPFRGNTQMLLHQVLTEESPSPRKFRADLPKDLETICLKCLQKDPQQRYASAQALADELDRFLQGEPILARPISRTARLLRWSRRNPVVAGLSGAAATLTTALLIVLAVSNLRISEALEGERAEQQKAQDALRESLTRQAHALWLAREPGWRQQALLAVEQAAEIRPDAALRDLAVQTLLTEDWSPVANTHLPARGELLAIDAKAGFAVAGARGVLRGRLAADGALDGELTLIWKLPAETRVTRLCSAPDGEVLVWSTDRGQICVFRSGQVETLRPADDSHIDSVVLGPGPDHLTWSDGRTIEVLRLGDGQRIDSQPWLPVADDEDFSDDEAAVCLVADAQGEFVIGTGLRHRPNLWRVTSGGLYRAPLEHALPSGVNPAMAVSADGRFLYLACNEPRWGAERTGGRLPPDAFDPGNRKPVIEAPPSQPAPDIPVSGSPKSPIVAAAASAPAGALFFTGLPPQPEAAAPPASQQSAGSSGGSKEPAPPAAVSRSAPGSKGSGRTESQALRPLSPLLSGPTRRVYLYQFEIQRYPEQSAVAITRLDPRTVDEFHIFRMGDTIDLRVAPDGEVLLAGSSGMVTLLRPAPPRLEEIARARLTDPPLTAASFSVDGSHTAFCSGGQKLAVWERTGLVEGQLLRPQSKEETSRTPWSKIAVSRSGRRIAVASWERTVEFRDLESGRLLDELSDIRYARDLTWSADGERMELVGPEDQTALQLSPFRMVTEYRPALRAAASFTLNDVCFTPDEPIACLSISEDGRRAYGLRNAGLRVLPPADSPVGPRGDFIAQPRFPDEGDHTVVRVVFDDRHSRLAAATSDGTVWTWSGAEFQSVEGFSLNGTRERWINDLCLHPTSSQPVAATTDSRLVFLTTEGAAVSEELETGTEILRMAFDLSGRYLLCGGRDGSIALWDAVARTRLLNWVAHQAPVGHVEFEPHGRILSAALDGEIRRWDLGRLGEQIAQMGIEWDGSELLQWEATELPPPDKEGRSDNSSDRPDPRRRLGRLAGDQLEMSYRVMVQGQVTRVIEEDGRTREITEVVLVPNVRARIFGADEPLPPLDYVRIEEEEHGSDSRAEPDPRRRLGRLIDGKLEMNYRVMVPVTVTKDIVKDGRTRTITEEVQVAEIRKRVFEPDEPLPDLDYVPIEPEQRPQPTQGNLLRNGNFEDSADMLDGWKQHSWRNQQNVCQTVEGAAGADGRTVLRIQSGIKDDILCGQKVQVKPHARYRLSGYILTHGVELEEGASCGASLSVVGGFERTRSLSGDNSWTFVKMEFDSKERTEVEVGPRLGHHSSTASGTA